jgi:hypothetical protein
MLADYSHFSDERDSELVKRLIVEYGVATIPLSAFYADGTDNKLIRLSFAKDEATLRAGARPCVGLNHAKEFKMKLRALVVGMGLLCLFFFRATELRYGLEAEYPPFESRNAQANWKV